MQDILIKLLKKKIIQVANLSNEGHIPSAFSILDIIYVLYEQFIKNNDSDSAENNNHFVLSKGHGSLALYAVLYHFKNITESEFLSFCKFNSKLGGHPDRLKIPRIEVSTGSLGHGLPIALGLALAQKIEKKNDRTFVLIGDGECNEGTTWESALFATEHKLNNLVCILDNNDSTSRALNLGDISKKFQAFGWETLNIDGHNHKEISKSLNVITSNKPLLINAKTTKGKGVISMENNPEWHHKIPNAEQVTKMLEELI